MNHDLEHCPNYRSRYCPSNSYRKRENEKEEKLLKEVNKFIKDFKLYDNSGEVTDTFTKGYCYWFAYILKARFNRGSIVYYHAGNHFAFEVCGHIFDITGDITDKNVLFEPWEQFKLHFDPLVVQRLKRDCIDKL